MGVMNSKKSFVSCYKILILFIKIGSDIFLSCN